MFDYDYFEELSDGEEKLNYLKKCIDEADNEKNYSLSLDLRYDYIKESVFNGDCYKAVIMFPEYMALFDKYPDKHDKESFMIAFKWIIEDIGDFYQVTTDMAESYFEEFKKRCEMYGYSLRTYYMKKMLFYIHSNPEKAKELHTLFRAAERDDLSDCEACEMSHDIRMELNFGTEEKALSMLNEMLSRGISCGEVPEVTYGKCIEHFTKIGELYEAEHYARLLMPMIRGNDNFLMETAHIILLKSMTEPNEALELFEGYFENYLRSRNPKMRFYFEDAAARFFGSLLNADYNSIKLRLPRAFPLYSENNEYITAKLKDYFYSCAMENAEKFDKRNGDSFFTEMLSYEYPKKPVKNLTLPNHSSFNKDPYFLGVPIKNSSDVPTEETIEKIVGEIPEIKLTGILKKDEGLLIRLYDENTESELTVSIAVRDIVQELDAFAPANAITKDEFNLVKENYKQMLTIGAILGDGRETDDGLTILKLADKLNLENSPIILALNDYHLLSAKWVKVTAKNNIPPLANAFYHIYVHKKSDNFIVGASGLNLFGSRALRIEQIKEENINLVARIMEQIAGYIIDIDKMPDENIETEFGVIYNNESKVMFGWKTPNSVYGDCLDYEDELDAIPYITVTRDGKKESFLLSEITADIGEKLSFINTRISERKQYAIANLSFRTALSAMSEGDILIIVFDEFVPDEYIEKYGQRVELCARITESEPFIKAVIESGVDEISELSAGTEMIINEADVFFWRLEKNGDYYFAEDEYLLT